MKKSKTPWQVRKAAEYKVTIDELEEISMHAGCSAKQMMHLSRLLTIDFYLDFSDEEDRKAFDAFHAVVVRKYAEYAGLEKYATEVAFDRRNN